jgi:hypothetical protein
VLLVGVDDLWELMDSFLEVLFLFLVVFGARVLRVGFQEEVWVVCMDITGIDLLAFTYLLFKICEVLFVFLDDGIFKGIGWL